MSILPVLGHKPITSYFSRASSTRRKRKETDTPGSSATSLKRQKQPANAFFPTTKSSSNPFLEEVDLPCTRRNALGGTLPTPPMTCVAPFRSRKVPENKSSLTTQGSESILLCQGDEPAIPLPTPLLLSEVRSISTHTSSQLSRTSATVPVVSDLTAAMPELAIPSSQSQDVPVDIPSTCSGKHSLLKPSEREWLIIESSQSQFLDMASPRRRRLELEPTLPALDAVVPTSQSQEKELTIPMQMDPETGARGSLVVNAHREVEIPRRTLSDELFSIPIQDSILDHIFSDEQALDTPAAGDGLGSNNAATSPDSETEDEDDGFPNSCYEARSLEPVGSYSSLPPEVWEFRKMFENGDESYPADFPESLRS